MMGNATTRQTTRRREVRAAILTAAREIAASQGWKAVTVRRIAAEIGYTPPIVYEHFASKDDVLLELLRAGFRELLAGIELARDRTETPAAALTAMADAYVAFAFAAPDLYQVMYGLGGVSFSAANTWEEGWTIGHAMGAVVNTMPRMQGKTAAEVESQVLVLWGTLHGLIALAMAGRLAEGADEARTLARQAVRDWIGGP